MYYSLCVATDFQGQKVNLQFFFDARGPQLAQILSRATEAFNQYFKSRGVERPFTITTAVIFNEQQETWDRLERSSQLVHNGQIYLFQPDVTDVPAEIPDPINATQYLTEYVSPHRSFINQSTAGTYGGGIATYDGGVYGSSQPRGASPGAQIPNAYDPYVRQPYHDQSPAYNHNTSSFYARPTAAAYNYAAGGNNNFSSCGGGSIGGGGAAAGTSSYGMGGGAGSPEPSAHRAYSRSVPQDNSDLHNNPEYQELMKKASSVSQRRGQYDTYDGPSIFAEERRHEQELSRLTLDQYRQVARSEARDFSPSPSRERAAF